MANPQVAQGTLNRLRASVQVPTYPQLTITPPYLGKAQIRLAFDSPATTTIPTSTGGVQSPEPYQTAMVTAHLLKTNALGPAWKAQIELNTLLGDCVIYPDTANLPIYYLTNCSIQDVDELDFSGADAGWTIKISGFYLINSQLWALQ